MFLHTTSASSNKEGAKTIAKKAKTTEYDSVLAGENWFLYWKTSPALWEERLRSYQGINPLFVPINWSLHVEGPDSFDFGEIRPETDLEKLFYLAEKVGRKVVFLLPLTPVPYLPNGGIPAFLSRSLALSEEGMAYALIDNENRINKLYSFYEPRLFQAFKKFLWHLAQYFQKSNAAIEVIGMRAGYTQEGKFHSYIQDSSPTFNQAIARFISQQKSKQNKEQNSLIDPLDNEVALKKEFVSLIEELYVQCGAETLNRYWGGVVNYSFIGGAPQDIFARSSDKWEIQNSFFETTFGSLSNNSIPSSVLVPFSQKENVLSIFLKDLVTSGLIHKKMNNELYEDEFSTSFAPLRFFNVINPPKNSTREVSFWDDLELKSFFEKHYQWTYSMEQQLHWNEVINAASPVVQFVPGASLDKAGMSALLKLFMSNGRVILDRSGLSTELERKLQLFLIENSIKTEKVNFLIPILHSTLGEGHLIVIDGQKLQQVVSSKRSWFWENVIKFLNIRHINVEAEEDVHYFWKSRGPRANELAYEEIRRVGLYNPSSYKKKAQILSAKHFAFLRIVDELNCKTHSTSVGIEIELLPGGSVSLDFGYYE